MCVSNRKYQNAVNDDLWKAMSNQSAIDALDLPASIKTIMDSWSLQTGYPIVTVRRNYNSQSAIVTQVSNQFPSISLLVEIQYDNSLFVSFMSISGTFSFAFISKYDGFPTLVDSAYLYN